MTKEDGIWVFVLFFSCDFNRLLSLVAAILEGISILC